MHFDAVNALSDQALAELILGPPTPILQSDRLEVLLPLLPGNRQRTPQKRNDTAAPLGGIQAKTPGWFSV